MKKFLLFASIAAIFASCSSKSKFELDVNIRNNNSIMNKEIFVVQRIDGAIVSTDSAKIKKEQFSLNLPYKGAALMTVSIPESDVNEIMMASEEGKIQLNIDGVKPRIGGSPVNDRLQAFLQQSDSVSLLFQKLDNDYNSQNKTGTLTTQLTDDYRQKKSQLLKENTDRIIAFIKENIDNPIGEYYFMTNYILFPMDRKLEMNGFATQKIKDAFGIK
ncbi:MAG: DUF4369 domain-containing protein [Tannerella sp.]|jgi:hypothetical protein|nr:DUF4369 domain-containing protein [Tannerella sp.]